MDRAVGIGAIVTVALLAVYAMLWVRVTPWEIGRSDFTSAYVGGLLLRQGHGSELYDLSAQAPLHAALIAPDREGNLPFVDAPVAAALVAPITLVSLDIAYRIWGLIQLAMLALAVVIAVRSAPWPARLPSWWRSGVGLIAFGGGATLIVLLQAQWGSVLALGLAAAYGEWRRDRPFWGAVWIVLGAGVAKPHLALGIFALMLGWRSRRVLAGAVIAGIGVLVLSVVVAGPAAPLNFVRNAITTNTMWQLDTFSGFIGIPGSFLGNSGATQVIGAVGDVTALGVALCLGLLVRRAPGRLGAALAGGAALSILASPHAGTHDLVLLAPAMVWWTAEAATRAAQRSLSGWQGPTAAIVMWFLLTCAVFLSPADGGPVQLVPWVLIAVAAAAWSLALRQPASAEHRAGDSTALAGGDAIPVS